MPRGHDGAVVLVVKGRTAKVDHAHARVLYRSLFSLLSDTNTVSDGDSHRLRRLAASHLLYVVGHREVRIDKEDVLRFEVCVCQFIVMENC